MKYIILSLLALSILLSGCATPPVPKAEAQDISGKIGTADLGLCLSQCDAGGAGSGPYCKDGCRFEQASKTKDTSYCDQLEQKANRGECYGTVAKAAGDIKICDRLSGAEKNECIASFAGPSTG